MFEGVSKCKFDLSDGLEQDFNAVIVTELFKEDCIILVLKLFKLYSIFGFRCCDVFCKGNMPTLVATC